MFEKAKAILANPTAYHYLRHALTGGLPLRQWAALAGLREPGRRVADLGCGPADILRHVPADAKPAFYLGIDTEDRYLDAARRRAAKIGLASRFLRLDLSALVTDAGVQAQLVAALDEAGIDTVLLFGVVHHLDDASALNTFAVLRRARTVRRVVTQDVIRLPGGGVGRRVNDFFVGLDRGEHIRTEEGYATLAARSGWDTFNTTWTHPGLSAIRYIHYVYER
ncbi:MAG TPA: class I SAM-dependent methyltransferase [Tepidisphaeraceae bacterium]|jgi:SAM-dependent methyltransferase